MYWYFPIYSEECFWPQYMYHKMSPNNGFRWCPLGKLSHLGLEQLKDKNHLTHHRISKYDTGQEIRTGTTECSGINEGKIPKFSEGKQRTDPVCDGGRIILQHWPPSNTQGRKACCSKRPGLFKQNQTQGFSLRTQKYQKAPNPTGQKHRFLDECMRYYYIRYIIFCYGVFGFLIFMLQCSSP